MVQARYASDSVRKQISVSGFEYSVAFKASCGFFFPLIREPHVYNSRCRRETPGLLEVYAVMKSLCDSLIIIKLLYYSLLCVVRKDPGKTAMGFDQTIVCSLFILS